MRITFVLNHVNLNGGIRVIAIYADRLRCRGHQVVVVTRPSAHWATLAREIGIVHHELPMTSEVDLASARRLITILRSHEIQVVHAHKGKGRSLAIMAGLFVRIPVLVLNRGVSFPLDRFQRFGYTTRRVTGIVAVCDAIKRGLVAQGVPAAKIEVIYSGSDTKRFHPDVDGTAVRSELGFGSEDFVVTQIGVRSWKGNDDVIEAMASLADTAPRVRLLIVGARNPDTLYATAGGRRLGARMKVIGYREDVPQILAASDCCVDASYAGLGLTGTLREALAVQTPVIGTDIEGNPELIIDGKTGLLVPPRRPEALAVAVRQMIDDPGHARAMAVEGQCRVQTMFSTTAKVDRTEELYRRLLRGEPAASE